MVTFAIVFGVLTFLLGGFFGWRLGASRPTNSVTWPRLFSKPEPKKELKYEPLRRTNRRWQSQKRELEQTHNSEQKKRDALYAKTR